VTPWEAVTAAESAYAAWQAEIADRPDNHKWDPGELARQRELFAALLAARRGVLPAAAVRAALAGKAELPERYRAWTEPRTPDRPEPQRSTAPGSPALRGRAALDSAPGPPGAGAVPGPGGVNLGLPPVPGARPCPECREVAFSAGPNGRPERRCWRCGHVWTPAAMLPRLNVPTLPPQHVGPGPAAPDTTSSDRPGYRGELAGAETGAVIWQCQCDPLHATRPAALACALAELTRRNRGRGRLLDPDEAANRGVPLETITRHLGRNRRRAMPDTARAARRTWRRSGPLREAS